MSDKKQKVAVIGAGPAGLCALKHLAASPALFEPVAFDRNFWPGGIWVYSDRTEKDEYGIPMHSAMYNKLKINVPKELQEFPSFPYPKEWTTSYITRQQCFEYLNMFMDKFDLRKYIKERLLAVASFIWRRHQNLMDGFKYLAAVISDTHTMVRDVRPIPVDGTKKMKWSVTYSDIRNYEEVTSDIFDAVLVCNGHDFNENVPSIPGMEKFKGRILHSRNYRRPEHFQGLRVAVLGCHYSGEDICLQVAKSAKKVYACHHRENMTVSFPKHIDQKPSFVRVTENSVVFPDGSQQEVEAIIFCTGYKFAYPFLKEDIIQIKDERITPIYRHMVHIKYPNLIFLNIPRQWPYFPHNHEMAKLAVLMLEGKVNLPSEREMEEDSEADYQSRLAEGKPPKFAHYMGDIDRMWRFNEVLAKMGGFDPLPPVLEMIWNDIMDEREMNLEHCNEFDYVITGKSSYKCLNPEKSKSTKSTAEKNG